MFVSMFFSLSNLMIAQDTTPIAGDEVVSLIPVTNISQERDNLNTRCGNCCIVTTAFLFGGLTISMLLASIIESSLPLRTYTMCNASNDTVNIAYGIRALARPTITILENDNCYGLQTYGSLRFVCAYNNNCQDSDDFHYSTDCMKCATSKGLEHNFQWYVDEQMFLNRGFKQDYNQKNYGESSYIKLSKIEDNNLNAKVSYHLRGSMQQINS
ncbi:hypothetical protein [Candidatus Chromulinivorax destructor]|uniref:Uncharacterized protein n=1 Tax=Candidatus Chromulinivorax destructor TaxID=2066483 RepID=A0A345ZD09_9BACT|nr:hypothetical protein [Candidatus Chromulinivorax destructor]AXK61176.1 hypothetical protein C0J27_05600 [Candidatus Chromulinivorax destructor]